MRKVIFRGIDKDTNEWCYGAYVPIDNVILVQSKDDSLWEMFHVLPNSVGEWSGCRDADNKMIFENDIVKSEISGVCYTVVFFEGDFMLYDPIDDRYEFFENIIEKRIVGNSYMVD